LIVPPEVTAVIGNYEGERLLPECLESLRRQSIRVAEVIVVDGRSSDKSVELSQALGAQTIEVENRGLGYLYNRGAEAASTEFVLLLNNDVSLDERCVELLRDALAADQTRFAADPRQVDWNGSSLVHARATLRPGSMVRELLPGLHLDMLVSADELVPTVTANGGAMLVRRSMLVELGGFDESFFMDFEDIDLCWRAWLRGWSSVYVPEAWLRHKVGGVTTRSVLPKRHASSHHNLTRFALKCFPFRPAARVLLGELLRLPVHPRAVGGGLARVALELPAIARARRGIRPSGNLFDWIVAGQEGVPPRAEADGTAERAR
jgi:GT2 family glycosyltransferase